MWDVLGIEPTNDERAIKRAYAKLLKQNRPDKDPVAFQELRDAYEWCLRATKWTGYDDYDDEGGGIEDTADDGFASGSDPTEVTSETVDTSTVIVGDDHDASDEELDRFLPPDGPAERIMIAEMEAFASSSDLPPDVTTAGGHEGRDDLLEGDDWLRTPDEAEIVHGSRADAAGEEADNAAPNPFETLVAEFESLLGDIVRARQSEVWQAWFEIVDEFSLHERQVLRTVIVDLTVIAWCDEPERTEQVLRELPYPAVVGLSDLLGWPHSQIEMSEHIPDDLVLLLGDVLEFDMITDNDRAAFFGPTDPAMVDVSMRPDSRRHRNGFILGPFWCLYRRQFRRTVMVIAGPIIISVIAALLSLAGVQVLVALALIALFPFYKAGDVRIRWFFVCVAAAIAMVGAFESVAIGPAFYVMFAVPLHIEAGIRGRQWREEQLEDAFAGMPMDIRADTDRRHDHLSNAGAPSKWVPIWVSAVALVIVSVLVAGALAVVLTK